VGEPEYYDALGRLSYDVSDSTTLFGSVLMSGDEMKGNTSDKTQRTEAEYRNTYVWGGWRQTWPADLSSRLILAITDIDNDREGTIDEPGQRSGSVEDRRTLRMSVARLDIAHEAPRIYTRFGVEARDLEARYHYLSTVTFEPDFPIPGDPGSTVTRDLAPRPEGHQVAAYLTTRMRMSERLSGEIGLRWDDQTYDDVDGPDQLAPRLNMLFEVTPSTRLRAAWGRYWQAQGINELQVEDGVDGFYPAQRAEHLIAGLEHDFPGNLDLRIEAYRKDYDRVRPHFENLFDPVKFMPELEPDRVEVAPESGRARGLELTLWRRADDAWSWWLSYAWSRVTDQIAGADVVRSWDQRHTVNAGLRYAGEHWEFTVTDVYHTGWPTTQLFLAPDPGGGPDVVTVGDRNAARFGDYNSLDFRILRRFDLRDSTLEAFFEVTNALVRRNPCCTEYEVTGTASAPVIDADQNYWPRIIPSLGVLWKF
jgi:outer membrane receptor protein involved in Fe transport